MISQAKQNGNHIKLPLDFKVNKSGAIAPFRKQGKLCIRMKLLANNARKKLRGLDSQPCLSSNIAAYETMKNRIRICASQTVIPAKAGIQGYQALSSLDPGFHRDKVHLCHAALYLSHRRIPENQETITGQHPY